MTLANLSKWENAKHLPKVDDLIKIAQYFDVTIDDLLLRDMSLIDDEVQEKGATYTARDAQKLQEIDDLRRRLEEIEAWRASQNQKF